MAGYLYDEKRFGLVLLFPVNINVKILFLFLTMPSSKIHNLKWICGKHNSENYVRFLYSNS